MTEVNPLASEKSELQHRGTSKLIALFDIPSIWRSQNDVFQSNNLELSFIF